MTRVVHTGDTHLGYQQYHRPERREDFLSAFEQVAADAIEADVDAVVHAGDLFHDRQPRLSDIMGALAVLRELDAADIPFLAIVGNHESKRSVQWLDLFEQMGLATRLSDEPEVIGETAFYGLDFVPRAQRDELEYQFEPTTAEFRVLVSHGLFEPFDHGDWDAREILATSPVDFDAVLLGDDHTPQSKQTTDPHDAWLTYCGSTERASAAERDERGYNIVTFEGDVDIRRRGLDTREFVYVDVTLGANEGTERVCEQVGQHDVTDAVVIVEITGEGNEVLAADIESFAAEEGALVTRVRDRRDIDEPESTAVDFADPDQAVRERIDDLGLSRAAQDIDETIRASKVADSNVADVVEQRVRDLVETGDATAFSNTTDSAPEEGELGNPDTGDEEAGHSSDEGSVNETVEAPAEATDATSSRDEGAPAQPSPDDSTEADEQESQVTMEDYL